MRLLAAFAAAVALALAVGGARIPPPPGAAERVRAAFAARTETQEREEDPELAGTGGRSRKYDLRCSNEEVERWTRAAQAEGVSTSEFLRLAADERAASLVS